MTTDQFQNKIQSIEKIAFNVATWQKVTFFITIAALLGTTVGSAVWKYAESKARAAEDKKILTETINKHFEDLKASENIQWMQVDNKLNKMHYIDSMSNDAHFKVLEEKIRNIRPVITTGSYTQKKNSNGDLIYSPYGNALN